MKNGSRKLFDFNLVDSISDKIHLFSDNHIANSIYYIVKVGIIYIVYNSTIKLENKNYNHLIKK